jgi:hypothetical protein
MAEYYEDGYTGRVLVCAAAYINIGMGKLKTCKYVKARTLLLSLTDSSAMQVVLYLNSAVPAPASVNVG